MVGLDTLAGASQLFVDHDAWANAPADERERIAWFAAMVNRVPEALDPGDAKAIAELSVVADQLLAEAHPLGIHLAHLLAGKREGSYEAVGWLIALATKSDLPPGYRWIAAELGIADGESIYLTREREGKVERFNLAAWAPRPGEQQRRGVRKILRVRPGQARPDLVAEFRRLLEEVRPPKLAGNRAVVAVRVDGDVQAGDTVYMRTRDGTFTVGQEETHSGDAVPAGRALEQPRNGLGKVQLDEGVLVGRDGHGNDGNDMQIIERGEFYLGWRSSAYGLGGDARDYGMGEEPGT